MNDSDRPTSEELTELGRKLDRVDELVSLLVDELITREQFEELESLLQENEQSRARYVSGMQLHSDLIEYYSPKRPDGAVSSPTVLSMLGNSDESGVHMPLPPANPGG